MRCGAALHAMRVVVRQSSALPPLPSPPPAPALSRSLHLGDSLSQGDSPSSRTTCRTFCHPPYDPSASTIQSNHGTTV
ncbi:unnamed protein product [Hydatigera taeniaeformis]|uniref:Secreted protein n=1 Tax=Hydatigena taeniaeformis TaxID=6205 RepID=A0A0R3X4A1_HYDTA|nr:unnamed protein product [Hydatigera taeniaeformis]